MFAWIFVVFMWFLCVLLTAAVAREDEYRAGFTSISFAMGLLVANALVIIGQRKRQPILLLPNLFLMVTFLFTINAIKFDERIDNFQGFFIISLLIAVNVIITEKIGFVLMNSADERESAQRRCVLEIG